MKAKLANMEDVTDLFTHLYKSFSHISIAKKSIVVGLDLKNRSRSFFSCSSI